MSMFTIHPVRHFRVLPGYEDRGSSALAALATVTGVPVLVHASNGWSWWMLAPALIAILSTITLIIFMVANSRRD